MSLTRTQMETQIKFRLGNRTDIDSQITLAVQSSYIELATGLNIPETEETAVLTLSTTDTVKIYEMPTDILYPIAIRNETEGERLEPLSIRNYDRIKDQSTRGKPSHYVWWRNELIIWKPNDTTARTLALRYRKRPAELSASTSTSVLPLEWDEVIMQGAYFRMFDWLQMKQEAQLAKQEYVQMLQRRVNRLAEAQFDRNESAAPVLSGLTTTTPVR